MSLERRQHEEFWTFLCVQKRSHPGLTLMLQVKIFYRLKTTLSGLTEETFFKIIAYGVK